MVIEIAPDMGVDRGGIARVDAVEAGVVVGRLAGIVIVAAGIAGVETADGEAPVPQKLLVEARRRDAEVRLLQALFRQPREARKLAPHPGPLLGATLGSLEQGPRTTHPRPS